MIAGTIVALTREASARYNWALTSRFEVVRHRRLDPELGVRCALLNARGERVTRDNGVEEHVVFPVSALVDVGSGGAS